MDQKILLETLSGLIKKGVSLIPVGEERHGDKYKLPFVKSWRKTPDLTLVELYDQMGNNNTDSVAMVLGKRSGGLICIDVDVKYKKGFDAILFKDLREVYPDLLAKMQVEKTPSGGYHLLVGIEGECPRSRNVAKRLATDEELATNPDLKNVCFLEIKGEGGLSQCYPSVGYTLIKEGWGVLSVEEWASLSTFLDTYTEIVKVEYVKVEKKESDWYSLNPYEDFDGGLEADSVLEDDGWKILNRTGRFVYYQRPNQEWKGVAASYSIEKNQFTIFTTSAGVDNKTYSPSNLLCHLKFGGDKKLLYSWLVGKGYGKIKPSIEKKVIENCAKYDTPLPMNVSGEGKESFEKVKIELKEKYPYGVFWEEEEGRVYINRVKLYSISHELGFRVHMGDPVKIEGYIVKTIELGNYWDEVRDYIKEEDDDVINAYEAFLQNSGKFTLSRLRRFDTSLLLRSTKKESYKFFDNGYLRIWKDGYEKLEYGSDIGGLVWESSKQKRDFKYCEDWEKGIYHDFLSHAIGISEYLYKCIGYYAHEFRDEQGYLVLLTEKDKEGGGNGKNVFSAMLGCTTTFKDTAASMIKKDNQMLQSWNGERVFCFSDIPLGFDYIFFKNLISGGGVVRKLFKDEYTVPVADMCKFIGSTNYSFDDADPGVARRIRPLEFTDYFHKLGDGALQKKYGKMFPGDFTEEDYNAFDTLVVHCIQNFLKDDCTIDKELLSAGGWKKQMEQKHGHLLEFIEDEIESWKRRGHVSNKDFNHNYELYCKENNIRFPKSPQKINLALADYCKHNKIPFEANFAFKENTFTVKGRRFIEKAGEEIVWSTDGDSEEEVLPF